MQLEANSLRLLALTRAQEKVRELGVPEEHYPAIPPGDEPEALLLTAVGILGDVVSRQIDQPGDDIEMSSQISTCARYFDALIGSQLAGAIDRDLALLASSAYYLAGRPGSGAVMARRLQQTDPVGDVDALLSWVLSDSLVEVPDRFASLDRDDDSATIVKSISAHFAYGEPESSALDVLEELRTRFYERGSPRDLLYIDLVYLIARMRLAASVWNTIPRYSGLSATAWTSVFRSTQFPKELWPSQLVIGQAGLFDGSSGAVVMPTSAGKTRAVEIILRAAFLSGRAHLAVVVAPFRALSHEIATSLRHSFEGGGVRVNELSDALQLDFEGFLRELLGSSEATRPAVLVMTPEKLHYVLRQTPSLAAHIGVLIYDECHQFDSGSRGVTYELLLTEISRMIGDCQTVLISAVMSNASVVANWALGSKASVVNGSQLTPTARATAFVSWATRLGQLQVFDDEVSDHADYFVPRVIEQHALQRRPRERSERVFPRKGSESWKDVSLYLGIKLVPEGSVAIFCGRKDTANGMAAIIADAYERGLTIAPPSAHSDPDETAKIWRLTVSHYGPESPRSVAARLGVFLHHGTVAHGLRLSIEHAMKHEQIRMVVCTSTLAQGVNLPIRYLIISGTRQGAETIKVRDFQNLLGRAGRAGMHTEGLVAFANPDIYDNRRQRSAAFASAADLLSSSMIEDMGSSLLESIAPIELQGPPATLDVAPEDLIKALYSPRDVQEQWAISLARAGGLPRRSPDVLKVLRRRRENLGALESHLMAMRPTGVGETPQAHAITLARQTLAYALADDAKRDAVEALFVRVTDHINEVDDSPEKQALYARTLLGAEQAARVTAWALGRRDELLQLTDPASWLAAVWDLYLEFTTSALIPVADSSAALLRVAQGWLSGATYGELASMAAELKITKPFRSRRRPISQEDVFSFCDQSLAFELCLMVAAVALALGEEDPTTSVARFQKCLKYGLPDRLSVSTYDAGIADRHLAQAVANALVDGGFEGTEFKEAWESPFRGLIADHLSYAPSWFGEAVR